MVVKITNKAPEYGLTMEAGDIITVYINGNASEVDYIVKEGNRAIVTFRYQEIPVD